MKKEKVKDMLEWLTSRCVKDIQKFLELAIVKDFVEIARPMYRLV